jgi:hypothetical protein
MKGNAKSSPSAVVRDVVVLVCAFAFTADAQRVAAPAGARAADQGSRIAFSADREGQSSPDDIYLMNAAGTGERRVTPTSDSSATHWLHDGRPPDIRSCFTASRRPTTPGFSSSTQMAPD